MQHFTRLKGSSGPIVTPHLSTRYVCFTDFVPISCLTSYGPIPVAYRRRSKRCPRPIVTFAAKFPVINQGRSSCTLYRRIQHFLSPIFPHPLPPCDTGSTFRSHGWPGPTEPWLAEGGEFWRAEPNRVVKSLRRKHPGGRFRGADHRDLLVAAHRPTAGTGACWSAPAPAASV